MDSAAGVASVRANLDGSGISTYILIMLVVPLKIWCRTSGGRAVLGWDDYLSIMALVSANCFFYVCMLGMRPDLGKHAHVQVPLPAVENFAKFLFAAQLLYTTSIALNKACIIAFYWRLFYVWSRVPLLVGTAVVVAWTTAIILCVIFGCNPIQAQWDFSITDSTCMSLRKIYLGGSIPNVLTDLFLLILPIPYIWKLNAPIGQRIMVGTIFSLGCFVSVVSIVRLTILMRLDLSSTDITHNLTEVVIWSIVEINTGLICACLPSLRPAIKLLGLDRLFLSRSRHPSKPLPGQHANGPARQSWRDEGFAAWNFRSTANETDAAEEDNLKMISNSASTGLGTPARSIMDGDSQKSLQPVHAGDQCELVLRCPHDEERGED